MKALANLIERIIQRVNIDLREIGYDVGPHVRDRIPLEQMLKFYAFYGITPNHPLNFVFRHSNLAGSYFLGSCRVSDSVLYKSDIRGDELKKSGTHLKYQGMEIPVNKDEEIRINDSFLIKTLVHCFSHDPETPETFSIKDTVSLQYANIHGSPTYGCFLEPFSTVDLTTVRDSVIGTFSYIQAGEISHMNVEPGTVWIRSPNQFNFLFRYPADSLTHYIYANRNTPPQGLFIDFIEDREEAFRPLFDAVHVEQTLPVPPSASVDRYAVIKPNTHIGDNVLVAQRAFLQNAWMGKGANAQENCYIVNSRLDGYNVTAHGAKIIEADLDNTVFVGFNSFLRGRPDCRLSIGEKCIVMPHTIIDIREPLAIPPEHVVWGLVTDRESLEENSIPLETLAEIETGFTRKNMSFEGSGALFVDAFHARILHILESNGAFFDIGETRGHAQQNQNISFNTIQPYPQGELEGLYPTIIIQP